MSSSEISSQGHDGLCFYPIELVSFLGISTFRASMSLLCVQVNLSSAESTGKSLEPDVPR